MPSDELELIDSHCHIHDPDYDFVVDEVLAGARQAGVSDLICVGTDYRSSLAAIDFASHQSGCWSTVALHPHEVAKDSLENLETQFQQLARLARQKPERLVAIGECGLDYHYHQDEGVRRRQQAIFRWHLDLAAELDLPLVFHVRAATDDFCRIYQAAGCPSGVWHSFTEGLAVARQAQADWPGLLFGLNGIMTFSQEADQLESARYFDGSRIILETDAPYLTPKPFRGRVNKPENLRVICQWLADWRGQSVQSLAQQTTANSRHLFKI